MRRLAGVGAALAALLLLAGCASAGEEAAPAATPVAFALLDAAANPPGEGLPMPAPKPGA